MKTIVPSDEAYVAPIQTNETLKESIADPALVQEGKSEVEIAPELAVPDVEIRITAKP